jgi:hypothetical protein
MIRLPIPSVGPLLLLALALSSAHVAAEQTATPPAYAFSVAAGDSREVALASPDGLVQRIRTKEFGFEWEYTRWLQGDRPRRVQVALELHGDQFSGLHPGAALPDRLHGLDLEATYLQVQNVRWSTFFALTLGSRSAGGRELNSDGFGVQAVALAQYAASDQFRLSMGIFGDSLAEGSDRLNPILGIEWQFAPQWELALGVPETALRYALSESVRLGLIATLRSDVYAIDEEHRLRHGLPDEVKLELTEVRLGGRIEWSLSPASSLTITLGVVALRQIDLEKDAYRQRFKTDGVGGGFLTASWGISF